MRRSSAAARVAAYTRSSRLLSHVFTLLSLSPSPRLRLTPYALALSAGENLQLEAQVSQWCLQQARPQCTSFGEAIMIVTPSVIQISVGSPQFHFLKKGTVLDEEIRYRKGSCNWFRDTGGRFQILSRSPFKSRLCFQVGGKTNILPR
eukprot:3427146-Rhodomonas_salina.1